MTLLDSKRAGSGWRRRRSHARAPGPASGVDRTSTGPRPVVAFVVLLLIELVGCDRATLPPMAAKTRVHAPPMAATADAAAADADAAPAAGAPQQPGFCGRTGDDAVRDLFCVDTQPTIANLHDLQQLLDLVPGQPNPDDVAAMRSTNSVKFPLLLSHSTALFGHLVSSINPRMIVIGPRGMLAFQRGVQEVELVTTERQSLRFDFYLLTFTRDCDATPEGCGPAERFTPQIENAWTSVRIEDDEELKDTPSDCRQCHQRGIDAPTLLMRELQSPWTHFFGPLPNYDITTASLPGVRGYDLMRDYIEAKGDEPYAGVDVTMYPPTAAFVLQSACGVMQPLYFDAPTIEDERYPYGPDGYATVPQSSPTWDAAYEAFKRGDQLALPYFDTRATDPDKLAMSSDAYMRYRADVDRGDSADLPDLADIFSDDPHTRAQVGLQTEPDATPVEALIQACGSCHNDVLDQSISRARFSIELSRLPRSELDAAIDRIDRASDAAGAMPPAASRQLDPDARDRLLDFLRQGGHDVPDPRLQHAAEAGMAGGAGPQNPD
jgi:hypothetical protein